MPKSKHFSQTSLSTLASAPLASAIALGLAALVPAPASAQVACLIPLPGIVNCGGAGTGAEVSGSLDPIRVTLEEGTRITNGLVLGTLAGADIIVNAPVDAVIESVGPGLVADSAGAIEANVSVISTLGDGAAGALLSAVDEVIFVSDGLVSTVGAGADGLNITGSRVIADLNIVRIEGIGSDAVEIVSTDGPIRLDADLIETVGGLSRGTVLRGAGAIDLSARAIRTFGTDAVAVDISSDPAACVLLGNNECGVTAAIDEITTEGFGGIGVLTRVVGPTAINIGVLRTEGDEAAGLDLGVDPDACVLIGAGACDTGFSVGELTTGGARAPGALVRAAGTITADIGVLRTEGDEAVGLDLATSPDACVLLGAGACGTSFNIGELTTGGAGATGILVRAVGATSGNVGVLRTDGDDAAGIDIAADPAACLILGSGACDIGLVADQVSTGGNGAAAVLIDAVGNVAARLGLLSTEGDGSTALSIIADPALCLALGPGSCRIQAEVDGIDTDGDDSPGIDIDGGDGPIEVDVGDIDTDGDDSPGIDIVGTGPIEVDAGTIDTDGDNSPGIDVDGGEGPITVIVDAVDTDGDNSPGIDIVGTGPITVDAGIVETGGDDSPGIVIDGDDDPVRVDFDVIVTEGDSSPGVVVDAEGQIDIVGGTVETGGADSPGIVVDGGDGPVTVDVGAIVTTGPDSTGIAVVTDDGDQTILAGPISATGPGSDGIVAESGCGDVAITARAGITAAGTAIRASSGCGVSVTTLTGADLSGGTGGIDVTSGTGATITIGGLVESDTGPAIRAAGAAADVTIAETGTVRGRILLTGADDRLVNRGLFAAEGESDFGAGDDLLVNLGTVRAVGTPVLARLERFENRGTIDMVDGNAAGRLTLAGDYVGVPGALLAIDVAAGTAGTPADRLIVGGAASGTTAVRLNLLGGPGVANPAGTVIVDAGTQGPGAFVLEGPVRAGFVDFSLGTSGGDTLLFALPNDVAAETMLLPGATADFWYQSADAFSAAAALRRDDLAGETGQDRNVWLQAYGGSDRSRANRRVDIAGTAGPMTLRRETDRYGAQGGVDFRLGGNAAIGLTGGWQRADMDFASGSAVRLEGYNVGAYALYGGESGLYGELIAKADFVALTPENGTLFAGAEIDGRAYGVEGEVGYRTAAGATYLDLGAGLAYVRTDLDDIAAVNAVFSFEDQDSLRGRIGLRLGQRGPGFAPFVDMKLLHQFRGDESVRFESGGSAFDLRHRQGATWGRVEAGVSGGIGRLGGFLSGWSEFGDGFGLGARLGLRF